MKHHVYDYKDIAQLQTFFAAHVDDNNKVIIQVHTNNGSIVNDVYTALLAYQDNINIIPLIEEDVESKLYITVYPSKVVLSGKENFLEHDLYKAIIESTKEGFWLLDEDLRIISINNAFAHILGYEKEELLGKRPYELFALVDEQQTFCEEQANTAHTSKQRSYELTFVTKHGTNVYTIVNATTIELPDNLLRTFAFITDITEQKEIEQRLLEQQHSINELNSDLELRVETEVEKNRNKDRIMYQQARLATMGEMIGNIAHQWRQPLNIIALIIQEFYISGQLGTLTHEKLEKEYTRANSVLQYMSDTIDDFRTFFQHSEESEMFSVNDALNSINTLVSKGLDHNNIEMDITVNKELQIYGHHNEFVQVLLNLINNSREAIVAQGKSGLIKIDANDSDNTILIKVEDNGGGINEKDMEQIFEPYFTTKHQTQGTGLGLYMSHQIIVNNMNGSIFAENRGDGTCFSITLPKQSSAEG